MEVYRGGIQRGIRISTQRGTAITESIKGKQGLRNA